MKPLSSHFLEDGVPMFDLISIRHIITSTYGRTLDGRVNFQQHISEMIHVSNALRFCVKMWCQSHLYGCF